MNDLEQTPALPPNIVCQTSGAPVRRVGSPKLLTYRIVRASCEYFFRLWNRVELIGLENIPAQGPVLLLPTHSSFLDPPMLGSLLGRECYFLSRDGIFRAPIVGPLLKKLNTCPIRRGASDREALKLCRIILEEGWPLGFFPEGTRSSDGRLGPIQPGFAMILDGMKQKVPYVPVVMQDTFHAMNRHQIFPRPCKVRLYFGPPAYLPEHVEGERARQYYQRCCDQLRAELIKLGAQE